MTALASHNILDEVVRHEFLHFRVFIQPFLRPIVHLCRSIKVALDKCLNLLLEALTVPKVLGPVLTIVKIIHFWASFK